MKKFLISLFIVFGFALSTNLFAESDAKHKLPSNLQAFFGNKNIEVNDYDDYLKKIHVDSRHFFISHDGRYIFSGPIYDAVRNLDIVEERDAALRETLLRKQPETLFVKYPSTTKEQYNVTVFTAINCPYCRNLHNKLPSLGKLGITVNYVMLPRGPEKSEPYNKTLSALCSDDPSATITAAMRNHEIKENHCEPTQLKNHLKLAQAFKVNSTPTFLLPNGVLHVGYLSPERLLTLLKRSSQSEHKDDFI